MTIKSISADFPFQSHYVDVLESRMHYVDEGVSQSKHTFLLLHGNPTSSYIWRNIIPYLTPHGRVIAPDLIGMGKSGKPNIEYTFEEHIDYVIAFIEQLALQNLILVVHDWGSGIGFHYANTHRENVSGISFLEGIVRPVQWKDANVIEQIAFKMFRHPTIGYWMNAKNNFFVNRFLPMMAGRKLTATEMQHYRQPFRTEADRKVIQMWPTQISFNGFPEFSTKVKQSYADYLPTSDVPKLMFHADPGMIIKPDEAQQIKGTWHNLEGIDLGKGKHYLQEQYPHEIGQGIVDWYERKFAVTASASSKGSISTT